MTRDEAADVFTHMLAKLDLPLSVKTDLLHAAGEWVYASGLEAAQTAIKRMADATIRAIDNLPACTPDPTTARPGWRPAPTLTLVDDKERG